MENLAETILEWFERVAPGYLGDLDAAVQPSLFATLAALAIAATTLISTRLGVLETAYRYNSPDNYYLQRIIPAGKSAARRLAYASMVFAIGALVGVVLDPAVDLKNTPSLSHQAKAVAAAAEGNANKIGDQARDTAATVAEKAREYAVAANSLLQQTEASRWAIANTVKTANASAAAAAASADAERFTQEAKKEAEFAKELQGVAEAAAKASLAAAAARDAASAARSAAEAARTLQIPASPAAETKKPSAWLGLLDFTNSGFFLVAGLLFFATSAKWLARSFEPSQLEKGLNADERSPPDPTVLDNVAVKFQEAASKARGAKEFKARAEADPKDPTKESEALQKTDEARLQTGEATAAAAAVAPRPGFFKKMGRGIKKIFGRK
jgi:hypothetical protein